jgi:hypothetical protein
VPDCTASTSFDGDGRSPALPYTQGHYHYHTVHVHHFSFKSGSTVGGGSSICTAKVNIVIGNNKRTAYIYKF